MQERLIEVFFCDKICLLFLQDFFKILNETIKYSKNQMESCFLA